MAEETEFAPETRPLRRGWTTGACATAATKSALGALLGRGFADPVAITLPGGQTPSFVLAHEAMGEGFAEAGIIKDAGDDPDVTHGALVVARLSGGAAGSGVTFHAGDGVGMVTKPGLPIAPGEPAINPVPRQMMKANLAALAAEHGDPGDVVIEISIPDGERLAQKTWNPRLGILGGLSVLGTTGVVVPFSCSAWIHSIHRGIDVARALGLPHVAGCTGSTSEAAVVARYGLPDTALLDMGDFAGGLLKYLRAHPIPRLTIGGGFGKLTKLAQGFLDLHSGRSEVDFDWLGDRLAEAGAPAAMVEQARRANTAKQVLDLASGAGIALADLVARHAQATAQEVVEGSGVAVEILVFDRQGGLVGAADGW